MVSGSVAYDELGTDGVSRVVEVRILRFGAPLFFANVGILKVGWRVCDTYSYHVLVRCRPCRVASAGACGFGSTRHFLCVCILHLIWLTGFVDKRADAAQEVATEAEVERPAAGHVKRVEHRLDGTASE